MRLISEEDCTRLAELHHKAETTPVVGFSLKDMMTGNDWASQAWRRVAEFQEELGRKYTFDHMKHAINIQTGELVQVKESG